MSSWLTLRNQHTINVREKFSEAAGRVEVTFVISRKLTSPFFHNVMSKQVSVSSCYRYSIFVPKKAHLLFVKPTFHP